MPKSERIPKEEERRDEDISTEYILKGLKGQDRWLVKDAIQRARELGYDVEELF